MSALLATWVKSDTKKEVVGSSQVRNPGNLGNTIANVGVACHLGIVRYKEGGGGILSDKKSWKEFAPSVVSVQHHLSS